MWHGMAHTDSTYVIFDGDKDQWAYRYMRGWNALEHLSFDFQDAHDLTSMTSRAQNEAHVKSQLSERMGKANQVIVLVGKSTKFLRKYVGWEIDLAMEKDHPIIVVNLKPGQREIDFDLCAVPLRAHCAIHVELKMKIIRFALDGFPSAYRSFSPEIKKQGWRYYTNDVYASLGL
jgi:hypothetical protein